MAIVVFLSLFFSLQVPGYCQESESPEEHKKEETKKKGEPFFKEWLKEELTIWTSPARIKKKSILFLGGLALTTVFLINNDEHLHSNTRDFTAARQWVKDSSSVITKMGSAPFNIGVIGTFYLGGGYLKMTGLKKQHAWV